MDRSPWGKFFLPSPPTPLPQGEGSYLVPPLSRGARGDLVALGDPLKGSFVVAEALGLIPLNPP